jgi:Ankyrin repeats (3 copies)
MTPIYVLLILWYLLHTSSDANQEALKGISFPEAILLPLQPDYLDAANPDDCPNEFTDTLLHEYARAGNMEGVLCLLYKNHPPNSKDKLGYTPLMWAALENYVDMVKVGHNPHLQPEAATT